MCDSLNIKTKKSKVASSLRVPAVQLCDSLNIKTKKSKVASSLRVPAVPLFTYVQANSK